MTKVRTGIFFLISVLSASVAAQDQFERYRKVEGYEVRPGVLVTPRYTADRQLCEIGIEKLRYSPTMVRMSLLSRQEIDSILEELVPASDRGTLSKDFPRELVSRDGNGAVSSKLYENVSIQTYYTLPQSKRDHDLNSNDLVVLVKWKHRTCK